MKNVERGNALLDVLVLLQMPDALGVKKPSGEPVEHYRYRYDELIARVMEMFIALGDSDDRRTE